MIIYELMHTLYELWTWKITMLMTSPCSLLSVSGGMELHSCVAQVCFGRCYGVVLLFYEYMWIYACMLCIVTNSGFPCYKLWIGMSPYLWVVTMGEIKLW